MWDLPFAVIRCGPGKAAAAAAAQAAVQYFDPLVLVSFGAAGTPDLAVPLGSLTVATSVVDAALNQVQDLPVEIRTRFEPDGGFLRELLKVPGTGAATLVCWEGHVASPGNRPRVALTEHMIAVDWESAGVARVAESWGVPWGALKVISDHGESVRLKSLAVVARRPLQWGAEAIRRACDSFVKGRMSSREDTPSKETSHED